MSTHITSDKMDTSPPAWLRSYKAHSSIIPNYASQVRPDTEGDPTNKTAPESSLRNVENEKSTHHKDTTSADHNPFTFPSTISLTLHNAGSLDNSYTNSTSNSSPQKATFGQRYDEMPPGRPLPRSTDLSTHRGRGPVCRFLAGIRGLLKSKTQNTLAH
ncbi:MAG: hypothetical protein Q9210_007087 [Variospora velana]